MDVTEHVLDDADMPTTLKMLTQLADEFFHVSAVDGDDTMIKKALEKAFTQGEQQDVLLTTVLVALRVIKSDVPVPPIPDLDLMNLWRMLLWIYPEGFFGRRRRKCVACLACDESLQRRNMFEFGPYKSNVEANALRTHAVNEGMIEQ